MVTLVKMPKLTWTMEEGIVGEWCKAVGDYVEKGTTLCEIETEKSVDELKAPESGVLRKVVFPKGSIVKVNEVVAIIAAASEPLPDEIPTKVDEELPPPKLIEANVQADEKAALDEIGEIKVSPVGKKMAEERGTDLKQIKGTEPEGRIVREDLSKAIEMAHQQKTVSLSRMREVTKNRLALSMKTALHVPLTMEVDMTEALKLVQNSRSQIGQEHMIHLTPTIVLIKAIAKSLEVHPILNARFANDRIEIPDEINIGVAVALEDGLVVPVLHNANKKTLFEIGKELAVLAEKARTERLSTSESTGGTFTVSNLGMYGIDFFAPIINPPESAILGVGRIVKRAIVVNDNVTLRQMMTLTLVFDHRIMDGAMAAKFLQTLKNHLGKPADLNDV